VPIHNADADPAQFPVELRGVGKSFGGTPVLSDINLVIEPGSVHGLVGENGAGKSTLSKIIAGLLVASQGKLVIGGQARPFAGMAISCLRQLFGVNQQSVHVEDCSDNWVGHPFTPVIVIPRMKCRLAKRKATTSGAVTMVAAAKVTP